jgi:hypothetical protein
LNQITIESQMKYFYDNGSPINAAVIINPFAKYYGKGQKGQKYASMNPALLDNYIVLVTGMFETKCIELEKTMNKMEASDYCMYISIMNPKYVKRRHAIYSRLNELESLRKTMVRAQQIQQSQINKLQKENYNIRSAMKSDVDDETSESREREIVLERNMRTIVYAKRSSKEITRTLAIKNIDPTKEKLEEALEDFVLFSEMMKEKHVALVERGICEL